MHLSHLATARFLVSIRNSLRLLAVVRELSSPSLRPQKSRPRTEQGGFCSTVCCCRGLESAGQQGGYVLFLLNFFRACGWFASSGACGTWSLGL